jgi:hypothetical protein
VGSLSPHPRNVFGFPFPINFYGQRFDPGFLARDLVSFHDRGWPRGVVNLYDDRETVSFELRLCRPNDPINPPSYRPVP